MKTCELPSKRALCAAAAVLALVTTAAHGQRVRLDAQREIQPPDYATFRLGPFYSSMSWTETVGYRYTTSSGSGTDYLINNNRGTIKEDGSDFPIISSLSFRNYLILNRHADLDASFTVSYAYYPMDTQDDEFRFDMIEEGVYGTLSSEFRLSPYLHGSLYDSFVYRTDYVDTRGLNDRYGGQDYEHINNTFGGRLNWLMAPRDTLTLSLSRGDWWSMDSTFDDQERTEYAEGLTYTRSLAEGIDAGAEAVFSQYLYKEATRPDGQQQDYRLFGRIDSGAGPGWMEHSSLAAHVGYSAGTTSSSGATNESDVSTMTGGIALDTQLRKDLSHRLSYAHSLSDGFNSSFEQHDIAGYELRWTGLFTSARFHSTYDSVQPSADDQTDYSTWDNGVTLSRALAKTITATIASTYRMRLNDDGTPTSGTADEDIYDYDTWVSSIATGFQVTKRVTFTTSYEHVERISDADTLDYTRGTFEAYLTYRRQF